MRFLAVLSVAALLCSNALAQSEKSAADSTLCGVDARWMNTSGNVSHPRSNENPVNLTLLVHLGRGSGCSSAEVMVTATYLSENQDFICGGTIRQAMSVSSLVQEFNIAVRPFMQLDFLRWRNQPGARGEQLGKRLNCTNIDGTSDIGDAERQKAGWMRLSVGVIPAGGGISVTEALFRLVP
jgi:hypothetical protein